MLDDYFIFDNTNGKTLVSLTSLGKKQRTLTIPNDVKCIGVSAFSDSFVKKLTIPEGVKRIEDSAFYNCYNLVEIVLPNTIVEVGCNAFGDCKVLKKIVIPKSVKYIGPYTFTGCENLEVAVLNCDIKTIEEGLFYGCNKLENIKLPQEVKLIRLHAFTQCYSLSEINLEGIAALERYSFMGCGIKRLSLPQSINKYEAGVFSSCHDLEEVMFPDFMKEIPYAFFRYCTNLKKITLSKDLEFINKDAFCNAPIERIFIKGTHNNYKNLKIEEFGNETLSNKIFEPLVDYNNLLNI